MIEEKIRIKENEEFENHQIKVFDQPQKSLDKDPEVPDRGQEKVLKQTDGYQKVEYNGNPRREHEENLNPNPINNFQRGLERVPSRDLCRSFKMPAQRQYVDMLPPTDNSHQDPGSSVQFNQ